MSPPRPVPSVQPKPLTPPPASPELAAAERRYREAGFALRRAEAALANAKKEKGADSPEARAAQQQVVEANAVHEQAQRELKEKLGLVAKRSQPALQQASTPKPPLEKAAVVKKNPIQNSETFYVLERIEVMPQEYLRRLEGLKSEDIKKILEEIKRDPKNGATLMELRERPRGEMLIRQTKIFREVEKLPSKPPQK